MIAWYSEPPKRRTDDTDAAYRRVIAAMLHDFMERKFPKA